MSNIITSSRRPTAFFASVLATLAVAAIMIAPSALAGGAKVGDLEISNAWTRITPPGAKVAGGFLTITNNGKTADRLIGGSTPIAGRIEVHQMTVSDGIMKMHEVEGGLEIEPGATVVLKPGGYHVMFMDLKEGPVEGQPVTGTLKFEKAGEVAISYNVAPLGAKSAGGMRQGTSDHGTAHHGDHK